jgi:hypothetical protein
LTSFLKVNYFDVHDVNLQPRCHLLVTSEARLGIFASLSVGLLKSQHNLASFCQIKPLINNHSVHSGFILVSDVPQCVLAARAISKARIANLRRERARRS